MNIKFYSIILLIILVIGLCPNITLSKEKSNSQILENKWINSNTFQHRLGLITIYDGDMAYFDSALQSWQPIQTNLIDNSTFYIAVKGNYHFYINKNLSSRNIFVIEKDNKYIYWKPSHVGYIDIEKYKIQILRIWNTSATITVINNTAKFSQAFGKGLDLYLTVKTDGIYEELNVSSSIILNLKDPIFYGLNSSMTYVGMTSSFNLSSDYELYKYNGDKIENNFSSITELSFRKVSNSSIPKILFPSTYAHDSMLSEINEFNNSISVTNIVTKNNNGLRYFASTVPFNWLKNTTGNVVIDPTATIQPSTIDTYIDKNAATSNFGTLNNIRVEASSTNRIQRTLINFNLSNYNQYHIFSANLSLYYYTFLFNDPVGRTYTANNLTQAGWTETGATWNKYNGITNWITAGGDYVTANSASATVPASTGWITWDITNIADTVVANNQTMLRILIKDNNESSIDIRDAIFHSREYATDISLRPKLTINYSPHTYLTTYFHSGISSLLVNGTSKINGTSTAFTPNGNANITSITNINYNFLYYKFNSSYYSINNPLYLTMNKNYTINSYAYLVTVITTGILVLPNNQIANTFFIGILAGVIFLLGIVAVILRRRND